MKRKVFALILALSLVLAGCGSAKSPAWADGMTVIAPFLASEGTEDFRFSLQWPFLFGTIMKAAERRR